MNILKSNVTLLKSVIVLSIILVIACNIFIDYWLPYFNHYFNNYSYKKMNDSPVVIGVEPYDYNQPQLVENIVKEVFPGKKIVYSNSMQPHLIIRSEHISKKQHRQAEYRRWAAPYITISAERYSIFAKRYRWHGLPLAEIVSAKPKYERQFYFPFITWCDLEPKRKYTNKVRDEFLVYIASNCIKRRDNIFAKIKAKDNRATALGKCSNPYYLKNKAKNSWSTNDEIYSKYNFVLAMENRKVPGYMTEKILTALIAGAIPIYSGDSELIGSYINKKAYINVDDFASDNELVDYIINLNKDKNLIRKMQEEPIFIDNKIPEFFKVNEKNIKPTSQIINAARYIRNKYDKLNFK